MSHDQTTTFDHKRNANALLDTIFDTAPIGLAFFDRSCRFVRINSHLAEMNGLPPEEHIGKRPDELFPALTNLEDVMQRLNQVMETGEPWLGVEIHGATQAPGEDRYWLENFFPVRQDGIIVGVAATVEEITASKQKERQIEILLREVNHRTKNMLSLVQAIVTQTGAKRDPVFVAELRDRIRSLAISQDMLIKNQWRATDLRELIEVQLAHFENIIGTRICLSGPPVPVCAAAAQTIGMAVHELATNAAKHGALSNADGRVDIRWSTVPETQGGVSLRLEWRESEGPEVRPPAMPSGGFGKTVLTTLIKLGLSGNGEISFPAEGFTWRMTCPLATVTGRAEAGSWP